jgi:hypothetical protein
MSELKDHTLMDKIENMLQIIIDKTLCSASQQKDHKLTDKTKNIPQIIIRRTGGGRGRTRLNHLV